MLIYVLRWWPSWISDRHKKQKFVDDLPMIIPGQFGFNCPDPMGKCSNAFFSETTNMIKAKLDMNVHWMVLYKQCVFCSDMKFKMAATAGLSLTLDPMGKMFQNASSLKPLGQLNPNFHIGTKNVKFVEDHPMYTHMDSLALIIFVVSEKKAS
jgi:hypothetical protein